MSEYRARQDETRTIAREQRQAQREAGLAKIADTRDMWWRRVKYLGARALGDEASMRDSAMSTTVHTLGRISMVGDGGLAREAMDATVDFLQRPRGGGMTSDDSSRLYGIDRRVTAALDGQEQRVLRGEALLELDPATYEAVFGDDAQAARITEADQRWLRSTDAATASAPD